MCLEIYHPEMPVQIPFKSEVVAFTGPLDFVARYTFLIRNGGSSPIERLWVLFPRGLFDTPTQRSVPWTKPEDITDKLGPNANQHFLPPSRDTLTLVQPDPNRPQFDREPLTGFWFPSATTRWVMPPGITADHVSLMRKAELACWQVDLGDNALAPQQARWFWWEVTVRGSGSPLGRTCLRQNFVLQQLASPIDVRRTFVELFEGGQRDSQAKGDLTTAEMCSELLKALGLRYERRVDIQYYELAIWPGRPSQRMIVSWHMERDLRLRSGSPRLGTDPLREPQGEPIYEWKSGSILEPDHAWKDEGFILHLTLAHA